MLTGIWQVKGRKRLNSDIRYSSAGDRNSAYAVIRVLEAERLKVIRTTYGGGY